MATTIKFGSTTSPCRGVGDSRAPQEEVERSDCDPDKLIQCPFDKNHQIRSCRFPYHLIKCRKNHPKLAKELKTCPYNARHLVHPHELALHTETCEDRCVSTEEGKSTNGRAWQVPVSTWVQPNMSENWDEEADDNAVPFVWGANPKITQRLDKPGSNNLGPGFRPPNTFPW